MSHCPGCADLECQLAEVERRLAIAEMALGFPIVAQHVMRYEAAVKELDEARAGLTAETHRAERWRDDWAVARKERDALTVKLAEAQAEIETARVLIEASTARERSEHNEIAGKLSDLSAKIDGVLKERDALRATLEQAREWWHTDWQNIGRSMPSWVKEAHDAGKLLSPVTVGGEWMENTIAYHVRACEVLMAEEQEKPLPNNAMIAVLCDSVRLTREYLRLAALDTGKEPVPTAWLCTVERPGLACAPDKHHPDCPLVRKEAGPDYQALYHELLLSVGNKYEGETRHQTALRYIREREQPTGQANARKEAEG